MAGWVLGAQATPITLDFDSSSPFAAYSSADPRRDGIIPDGSTIGWSDQILASGFAGDVAVTDVQITLTLLGGYNGDLYAYLAHEGYLAVLANRPGKTASDPFGYTNAGFSVRFSDQAAAGDFHLYQQTGGSIAGSVAWQPDGRATDPRLVTDSNARTAMLGVFSQHNAVPNGAWTLCVYDLSAGGQARVASWNLEITAASVPEPSAAGLLLLGGAWAAAFCGYRYFKSQKRIRLISR